MLNARQLLLLERLESQPCPLAELALLTSVSTRTVLRDIDYLNVILGGHARVTSQGNHGIWLDIIDRQHYFRLLQRHDNDDRLLALLLINGSTPRQQLADSINLPELRIAEMLLRLRHRYEKVFTLAGRPGVGYYVDETQPRQVLILASLLRKDPFVIPLKGVTTRTVERLKASTRALTGWPALTRDDIACVILAVWATRNRLQHGSAAQSGESLTGSIENAGLYFSQPMLNTALALLDLLQQQAERITAHFVETLLQQTLAAHPAGMIDAQLTVDLVGHLTRCAASPCWLAENRQASMLNLKAAWPVAFDMSVHFTGLLRQTLSSAVFDSDLIGLYFACALERHQAGPLPVLLLADSHAVASINKIAIERGIPHCQVIVADSPTALSELLKTHPPACIVNNSAAPLPDVSQPTIAIRHLITDAGIARIREQLESAAIRQHLPRLFPAHGSFHYDNHRRESWQAICAGICQQLTDNGLLRAEDARRLCQREREGENLIVNHLAIPHCWSDSEPSFRGFFITLQQPVTVNHEQVNHVLIACASATASHERRIFSYLANVLIRQPVGKIAELRGYEDFIALLR